MKFNIFKAALVGFALTVSCGANAGLITETQVIYEDGNRGTEQNQFNWTFENLVPEISDITLTFEWEDMDFTDVKDDKIEYFDIYSGSTFLQFFIGAYDDNTDCFVVDNPAAEKTWSSDCYGSKSITLTDTSLWSSSSLNIWAKNVNEGTPQGVQSNGDFNDDFPRGFIAATISYEDTSAQTPVPEPSTLAIFALGLFGLASRRFKK